MDQTEETQTPRIYVASLADYNAGELHGRWIDADQPAEAIREQIRLMLAESEEPIAEEWAIHDHDGFEGYDVHEFADIDHVAEVAQQIAQHGPVFAGLLNNFGGDLEQATRSMDEAYRGEWETLGDYVYDFINDLYHTELSALPDIVRSNIDYEHIARDLELGGDLFTIECSGAVHVFDQL